MVRGLVLTAGDGCWFCAGAGDGDGDGDGDGSGADCC